MLLTLFRTAPGLDEQPYLDFLKMSGSNFQNFSDVEYINFHAKRFWRKLIRHSLRTSGDRELAQDIDALVTQHRLNDAIIFNGRGIGRHTARSLGRIKNTTLIIPDAKPQKEHDQLIPHVTRLIFTKPTSYNGVRFAEQQPNGLMNLPPAFFPTDSIKSSLRKTLKETHLPKSVRTIPVLFIGNHSPHKQHIIEELMSLSNQRATVIGTGWTSSREINALGPLYGSALRYYGTHAVICIAITDSWGSIIDPITVRYYHYTLLNSLTTYQLNQYNRSILASVQDFAFETLPEGAEIISAALRMTDEEYQSFQSAQIDFVMEHTSTAETIIQRFHGSAI